MKRQREILILLVSAFVVVVVWIGVSLYHNAHASTINDALSQEIIPISPNFNTTVLDTLKKRTYIDPIYTFSTNTASSSSKITVTPTVTIQESITSIQNSTNSGTLSQ